MIIWTWKKCNVIIMIGILYGSSGVGKTSFFGAVSSKVFVDQHRSTITPSLNRFYFQMAETCDIISFDLWDTGIYFTNIENQN